MRTLIITFGSAEKMEKETNSEVESRGKLSSCVYTKLHISVYLQRVRQTLDGQPGSVLGLTVHTACSADVNTFIALLKILNPVEKHGTLNKPCVIFTSLFSGLDQWVFVHSNLNVRIYFFILYCCLFSPSQAKTMSDSPEHSILDVVVWWQGTSFLQPFNFGFYTTCSRTGELHGTA